MPPLPKRNPARRNRTSTKATLAVAHDVTAPDLPARPVPWHPQTVEWWADVWASPMAPEYDESDRHGLFVLAALVDDYWTTDSAVARVKLAGEIRQQRQCFGLTPIDRRRLQWEIERTDEAQAKGAQRRTKAREAKAPTAGKDPRAALAVAS